MAKYKYADDNINAMTTNCSEIAEELPLTRVFRSSHAKVLDFLILNTKFDYSEADISKQAKVPSRTLQRIIPCLLEEKLVVNTRKSGRTNMYAANLNSKRVLALQDYLKATIEENLGNEEVYKKPNSVKPENNTLF